MQGPLFCGKMQLPHALKMGDQREVKGLHLGITQAKGLDGNRAAQGIAVRSEISEETGRGEHDRLDLDAIGRWWHKDG